MGQVFVRASKRARAYTRGTRSKLAKKAAGYREPKLKTLKSSAYARYKTLMYTKGGSTRSRSHAFKRLRKLEKALDSAVRNGTHGYRKY